MLFLTQYAREAVLLPRAYWCTEVKVHFLVTVKSCIKATLNWKPHSNRSHPFSKLKLHKGRTRVNLRNGDCSWRSKMAAQCRLYSAKSYLFSRANCLCVPVFVYIRNSQHSQRCDFTMHVPDQFCRLGTLHP